MASYGRRPQFDNGAPLLEVHVLDFAGDLYGEEVTVTFHDWIRPELRFPTVDDLVARMGEDVAEARAMLAAARRRHRARPGARRLLGLRPRFEPDRRWFIKALTIWPDFRRVSGVM